jgi:predicted nuclease of predicted toxin-antitoxin system
LRFLVDAQLPPSLVNWLRGKGCDALHVFELDRLAADDFQIWQLASSISACIVTKDKDFIRFNAQSKGPQVLWLNVGNCSNADLLAQFEQQWQAVSSQLQGGTDLVEMIRL